MNSTWVTSWTQRASSGEEMPSCPSLQVGFPEMPLEWCRAHTRQKKELYGTGITDMKECQ